MHCIIVFICLSVSISGASKVEAPGTRQVGEKVNEEWEKIKREVMDACKCSQYNCGCCMHLQEKEIHLNSTICANISYLVQDYGISVTVTVNDYAIFNETVSARNPPPICLGVPYVKEYADVCIRIYDINATSTFLHACVRAEARMKIVLIAKYEFGCFNIGHPGLSSEGTQKKQVKLQEDEKSKESNANMAVTVVGIAVGIILVASIIFGIIAMARKRGRAYSKGLLSASLHNYDSLVSLSHGGNTIC